MQDLSFEKISFKINFPIKMEFGIMVISNWYSEGSRMQQENPLLSCDGARMVSNNTQRDKTGNHCMGIDPITS